MVTDIWFTTEFKLEKLAEKLGLENIIVDAENYWEWAIGDFMGFNLDITRTHTVKSSETETRIFLVGEELSFPNSLSTLLATKLKILSVSPIHFGRWIHTHGNEYKQYIRKTEI